MPENSPTAIQKSLPTNLEELTKLLGDPIDLQVQTYGSDHSLGVVYLDSLTDEIDLKTNLLRPILPLLEERARSLDKIVTLLPETGLHQCPDMETAAADLLQGRVVLFLNRESTAFSFKLPGWARHELKEPKSEAIVHGPREGFTETLSENVGIIRRWIHDHRLRADQLNIGRRTKTKVAVIYLSDVARPRLVQEVKKRLSAIDIDGVIDSGYLEQLIKDRRASIFPLTQATERTDKVTAGILEGRVAILVDKSPFVILVPVTANELYQSSEDYYIDFWLASLNRLFRLLGNILAVGLPGLYVAFASANPDLLPTQLTLLLAGSRAHAPLPLALEVFLLEVMVGIFFESGIRLPGMLSQTIGISFGVTIGLASILSGLVSPITMMIVAITAVASYTSPNFSVGTVWRLLKYFMLLAASLYGFFGLSIAGVLILGHMADLKSFGVSYMAPWAPLQWPELIDAPVRAPFWSRWKRPKTYRPQDQLRFGSAKEEDDEND
ncbi:MAG TPA: spore germination protein [Bacillota bacterium]|nr:spore germination protein [Bacillota bacterium]